MSNSAPTRRFGAIHPSLNKFSSEYNPSDDDLYYKPMQFSQRRGRGRGYTEVSQPISRKRYLELNKNNLTLHIENLNNKRIKLEKEHEQNIKNITNAIEFENDEYNKLQIELDEITSQETIFKLREQIEELKSQIKTLKTQNMQPPGTKIPPTVELTDSMPDLIDPRDSPPNPFNTSRFGFGEKIGSEIEEKTSFGFAEKSD